MRSLSRIAVFVALIVSTTVTTSQAFQENSPSQLSASHVLIMHKESARVPAEITRTKAEALTRAKEVVTKARAKGADFAALAKEYSDGPSKVQGGALGAFAPGQMVKEFSAATMKLKIGEISDPVETQFGYHVILRTKVPPPPPKLSAAHILIMHTESERAPASIKRSKAEALKLAKDIAKQAQAANADFAALAKKHSDGPSGPRGGELGVFPANRMVAAFSKATLKLKFGQVSDPVESPFGYHIILRNPIIGAKHILVMHKESERVPASITRTKAEAMARIKEAIAKLEKGEKFEALAKEYSDGPSKTQGGDLGEFGTGQMVPAFDKAAFACKVGGVSDIVETPFGYHVIYRYK